MPYPTLYDVTYSYTGFQQAQQGISAFPGTQLDADLAGLQASIDDLNDFMQTVIRSDGALNNGSVTYDSLSPELNGLVVPPASAWATATSYVLNQTVTELGSIYRALVSHTSGVFATDLAAGKWLLVAALPVGPAGTNGTNGTNGANGANGTNGTNGAAGLNGILSGVRLAKTAAYTVASGDVGKTIALGGSAFYALTFSAASGYAAPWSVRVVNEDTTRGKTIACNGIASFILAPLQSVVIENQNNVWLVYGRARWAPTSQITLRVDPGGNDANDGLATGSGAFQTLLGAANWAYSNMDTRNIGSVLIDGGGNTFQEFVTVFYPITGGGTLLFQNLTWKPANSGYCCEYGDGALVGLTGVTLSSAGTTSPKGFMLAHNHGVLDVNLSVVVTPTVAIVDVFANDGSGDTHLNINNGLTVNAGTISGFLYNGNAPGMNLSIGGAHVFNGTLTIGRFGWVSMGTKMRIQGNFTVTNTGTVTISALLINQGGLAQNLSGIDPPGGAPATPTTGGQYNTSLTA